MNRKYYSTYRSKLIINSILNTNKNRTKDATVVTNQNVAFDTNTLQSELEPITTDDPLPPIATTSFNLYTNVHSTEPQPCSSNTEFCHIDKDNNTESLENIQDLITMSDLDDSVADKDYIPSDFESLGSSSPNVSPSKNMPLGIYHREAEVVSNDTNILVDHNPDSINIDQNAINSHTDINILENIFVADYPGPIFTSKEEAVRNRSRKPKSSIKQRSKHPMIINSCTGKCTRKCTMFSLGDRIKIWNDYWDLNFSVRRHFLNKCIQITGIKKRKVNSEVVKKESRYFYFPSDHSSVSVSIPVCRKFFLDTLGYTTDGVITELSKAVKKAELFSKVIKDGRGGKRKEIPKHLIEQLILSYQPVVSHYRRHNAPNVKYLPRNLTLNQMYADFKLKNRTLQCGIEVYRQTIKKLNISFNMPKGDKCADCSYFEEEIKKCADKGVTIAEDIEMKEKEHKEKVKLALERYKLDAREKNENIVKYYAMDLQKVILIPEMPQYKDAFFLSRLIAFNLTFAPIEKKSADPAVCVLWHEAIAGRDAGNIVDAFKAFLDAHRDVQHFHFWAENCMAQNKNWTLFSAIVMIVNNEINNIESITIKYLTKGHTHMAADAVHANIEQKMKRQRGIYDFTDFKDCVLMSRKNIRTLEIQTRFDWPKKKRTGRFGEPLRDFQLKSVVQVKFVKGSRNLFYKTRFDEDVKELDFLVKKFDVTSYPSCIDDPRGVKEIKKRNIIEKLVPMMPESRKAFWHNLPTNDTSTDLSFMGQIECND